MTEIFAMDYEPIAAWLQRISAETQYSGLASMLLKAALSLPFVERGAAVFSEMGQVFEAANADFPRDMAEVFVTMPPQSNLKIPEALLAQTLEEQRAIRSPDPDFRSAFEGLNDRTARPLCVPLMHKDFAIGVLYLEAEATADAYSPACLAVISMLASQAAVSFESARLFAALRETHQWMTTGQKVGRMGSYRFNARTLESRGSQQVYEIVGLDPALRPVPFSAYIERIHPDDLHNLEAAIFGSMERRTPYRHEYRVVHQDGTILQVAAVGEWEEGPTGDLELEGIISDVTEQRAAQRALADANAQLERATALANVGEIAGAIIHEINQPLTAIITGAEASVRWLNREVPDVREARAAMLRTCEASRSAVAVVQSLRSLAKRSKSNFADVLIDEAIEEVLMLAGSDMERFDVVVRLRLDAPSVSIVGDRVQLQQVILNLVRNAAEAMQCVKGRPRLLTVESAIGVESVEVAFHDTGHGISPHAREHLFQALYTTKSSGLGLGLAICRKIMSAHDGRLWATDNVPHGTSFRLALPIRRRAT